MLMLYLIVEVCINNTFLLIRHQQSYQKTKKQSFQLVKHIEMRYQNQKSMHKLNIYKTTRSIKTLRTRTSKEGRNQRKTAAIHTGARIKLQLSNILRIKLTRVSGDVEEVISQNRKQVYCSHTPHYAFDK
ncbi:hypothetical protein T05_7656 [Trichinella murrelli]|uniref:Uncharacterized protein n=1 Tax=Trichinella murrelli TaxID=144512 RepID=A0A0V0UDU5_9BILA|nr:hypothetical protein T05_7656 [Trichinella murrelli]